MRLHMRIPGQIFNSKLLMLLAMPTNMPALRQLMELGLTATQNQNIEHEASPVALETRPAAPHPPSPLGCPVDRHLNRSSFGPWASC